jgi:hypothetical protein
VAFGVKGEGLMKSVLPGFLLAAILMTSCGGNPSSSPAKPQTPAAPKGIVEKERVEKERVEKEEPLPPEVKIRLKRDGKDSYSWELSGSDADEILKVNEKLKKKLTQEKPQ